ncbi:hypothetical protein SH668x_002481 [Planctomicrobium sp. SH668]|uniref:hypothetical protein n=1 Tax=Planctomicrobium sp. SH668 TaxID=3448126 RepID=UPI003F5C7C07
MEAPRMDEAALPMPEPEKPAAVEDSRLYVPETEQWTAHILKSWDRFYCFSKNPGEDYYHLVMHGEIYLQRGDEVYCVNCALRDGIITRNRLYWQNRSGGF